MKVKYIDLEMGLLAVVIAFTAFINISTFHIANYREMKILMLLLGGVIILKYAHVIMKKEYQLINAGLLFFACVVGMSSFINRGLQGTDYVSVIVFAFTILEAFSFVEIIRENEKVYMGCKIIYICCLVTCILSDLLMIVFPSRFSFLLHNDAYLVGNKFNVCYTHLYLLLFFCATHNLNRKRNRIVLVMLLVESIVVALSVNCTTGMISFFIFALLIVTKDRIYSIVEKPTFFVLLTIGLDLLLVVNSAVLSIPVISNFITNTLGKDITLTGRMGAYARFFLMMSGHYLLGYGLDHNYWVCLKGLTSNSLLPIYNAQNGIFDSIVSYGLIGTILVFLVSCEMIKKGRKKSDYAFLCGIYVFGMLSMVEVTLNLKFIILLAFVGLAWEKEKVQDNNDEW